METLMFHPFTATLVSRQSFLACIFACMILFALTGCATASPLTGTTPTKYSLATVLPTSSMGLRPTFKLVQKAGIFTVYGVEDDQQAAQDIAKALQENAPQVNLVVEYDYRDPVTLEIFPDQDSLDHFGMNPDMQGYYAYSGDHRIQMVSPRNAMGQLKVEYSQRVLIAVHEYAHLVNNGINPNMPLWLNEGVAIYNGPHEIYTNVCQNLFPFEQVPSFSEMERSYDSVPAADLFAYALVDFIVNEYGQEKLNLLIRNPDRFEDILGTPRSEFEQHWREYMNLHYSKR